MQTLDPAASATFASRIRWLRQAVAGVDALPHAGWRVDAARHPVWRPVDEVGDGTGSGSSGLGPNRAKARCCRGPAASAPPGLRVLSRLDDSFLMLTRTLGSILRGKATTSQVLLASLFGGIIGFVPAALSPSLFGQSPALAMSVLACVVVLQANLAVFGLVAASAKFLSWALLPFVFELGRLLLEGPLQGLFAILVNAPFFAWFGLEHYCNAGGLVLGAFFGLAVGLLIAKTLIAFRRRMADVEQNSERYQRFVAKRRNRILVWIFLGGGHGKKLTYADLAEAKGKRLPLRWSGVAFVALAGVSIYLLHGMLGSSLLRTSLQRGLEKYNGASVDLAATTIDLSAGHVSLDGLAIADRERLDRDVFRARRLSLTIEPGAVLSRRLVITELTCADASTGAQRERPARRIDQAPLAKPPVETPKKKAKRLEDYVAEAKRWHARLEQASRWLARLSARSADRRPGDTPSGSTEGGESEDSRPAEQGPQDDLSRDDMTRAVALHLRRKAPIVLVRELRFEGVVAETLGGELIDVHAKNLSSEPWLVDAPLELTIRARSGAFALRLVAGDDGVRVEFDRKAMQVDEALAGIQWPGKAPLRGGELDLSIGGRVSTSRGGVSLDLPLELVFRKTTVQVADLPETAVERLAFPIGLSGPLASPSISFEADDFAKALVQAGKAELAKRFERHAAQLLEQHAPKLGDAAKKTLESVKKGDLDAARKSVEKALPEALPKGLPKTLPKGLPKGLPKSVVPKGIWPSSGK